jgi:NADP-dependent 3-hydroxy acid dehydrogenase YdfG
MDLIILNDGLYQLIPVSKQMMEHIALFVNLNCFDLCDILRLKLTTYHDSWNTHFMNDGSGDFYGCICKE